MEGGVYNRLSPSTIESQENENCDAINVLKHAVASTMSQQIFQQNPDDFSKPSRAVSLLQRPEVFHCQMLWPAQSAKVSNSSPATSHHFIQVNKGSSIFMPFRFLMLRIVSCKFPSMAASPASELQ